MTDMNKDDKDLEEIFHGEEKPLHPDTVHITLGGKKETAVPKEPHKPTHNFENGKWEPVKEHTWMDNLKSCVKWAGCFGGLSLLVFYWQQAGLMANSIAVPTMCVCTCLAGWGVGRNVGCK